MPGDDLEQNWIVDSNVALASDDEDHGHATTGPLVSHYTANRPHASQGLPANRPAGTAASAFAPPQLDPNATNSATPADPNAAKKRKRKAQKENRAKRRKLEESSSSNQDAGPDASGPAFLSPADIATYLIQIQKKTFNNLTQVEFDDMAVPESSIVDTAAHTEPRPLDTLPHFIHKILPGLHKQLLKKPNANGSPTAIIVAGAALRVADVVRICKPLRGAKGGEIAKLFAKHMKVAEQAEMLRTTKISIAVGTPDRLGKLISLGALKTDSLEYLIFDLTFRDPKNRNLLDIPETRRDVFTVLLGQDEEGDTKLMDSIKSGKVKLLLY